MFFSGLDEEMQDVINSYSLTVYYFEDISDDEVNELFFRLNNGQQLTTYQKFRTRSKTLPEIQRVAAHGYFKTALDEKKISDRVNEDWVLKSYIMMTFKEPCLDSKVTNPTWINAKLTEDDINNMNAIFDRILKAYNTINPANNTKIPPIPFTAPEVLAKNAEPIPEPNKAGICISATDISTLGKPPITTEADCKLSNPNTCEKIPVTPSNPLRIAKPINPTTNTSTTDKKSF